MDDHVTELTALAGTAKRANPATPHQAPMPNYDFEELGGHLADAMVQAADDMLSEASRLAEHTRLLAADIRAQVAEQSKLLGDINVRLKATGEQMLEAARKFNG